MTIIFDASSSKFISNAATLTQAHTCSGSNRALVVAVSSADADYFSAGSATYGGVSLGTPVVSRLDAGRLTWIFVLLNPPTGTNNIVLTPTQATYLNMVAASFTDVASVGTFASFSDPYAVNPVTTAIAVPSGGIAVDAYNQVGLTGSLDCHASQALAMTSADLFGRLGMSYKADATAMAWTQLPDFKPGVHLVVALAPVAGANTPPTFSGPNIGAQSGTVGIALTDNNIASKFSDTDALTFTKGGTWPAGVNLSSVGVISGTPTTAGTYAGLTVAATDTGTLTVSSDTFAFTISATADTTVPTQTGTIVISGKTATSYTATWPAGADNVGVTGYQYRINAGVWQTLGNVLSVNITGRTPGATDTFEVRAFDGATNYSTPALSVSVTLNTASGSFVSDVMENNTGAGVLASTVVSWTWYKGAIGAAPTDMIHGTGTTSTLGVLTATGLPVGAGFLLARTTDSTGVYYQPGTVA